MELELALIADAANVSREGKLNILGAFDTVFASTFPMQVPQIHLVMRFRADPVEAGRTYKIEIHIIDEDAKKLATLAADMSFGTHPGRGQGVPLKGDHILTFANAAFNRPGTYEFVILINDEVRRRVPLYVQQQQPRTNPTEKL